jgi:hypothetical protein
MGADDYATETDVVRVLEEAARRRSAPLPASNF